MGERRKPQTRRTWSEDDIQFLKENLHLDHKELGDKFGVAPSAITKIKQRYGLSRLVFVDDLPGRMWKEVAEFPSYLISDHGELKNSSRGNLIKARVDKNGYLCVQFKVGELTKSRTLHRLVALAFLTRSEKRTVVNHKDGNKLNNHVSNLEWVTAQENIQHAHEMGLMNLPSGDAHWSRRNPQLFEERVRACRK